MHSQQTQVTCCCKLSCTPQVVTPAGAGTAKASEAAQTGTATAASPSATPGVSQQGQIIGVRTLLEFVAWLVCASLKDSSASTAHGKLRADALPAGLCELQHPVMQRPADNTSWTVHCQEREATVPP